MPSCRLLIFLVLSLPVSIYATDLTIGRIESPVNQVAVGRPIPVRFWVKNINVLDAPQFTLTVTITKKGQGSPIYTSTFQGTNLPKFDSALFTAPTQFTPPSAGEYDISINVNFAEDIDRSNDTKNGSFTALEAPNLGTRIRQFSTFGPSGDTLSTLGIIEFTIPPTTKPCFINVLIRRNDTSQAIWIVRNLLYMGPDFTSNNPIGMFVNFARLGILRGQVLDSAILCISCTDVPLSEAPEPDVTCEFYPVTPDIYAVAPNNLEATMGEHPEPFFVDSLQSFLSLATLRDTVERGCTMPNIDLDSGAHPGTAAGYKGDKNACGPSSIANSMQWLEESRPDLMNTGLTHRQKMEEISAFSNRQPNGPTGLNDFIKSKLAFIDKYKLPIKVKFQKVWGANGDIASPDPRYGHSADDQGAAGSNLTAVRTPQWAWVVQEMKDSEDVELFVGWWDSTGNRTGGHYFVLTGVAEINGAKQFRFKDDADQLRPGGTRMPSMFWNVSSSGWPRVLDWSWTNSTCFVEAAVSESFDTSVKFIDGGVEGFESRRVVLSVANNPSLGGEDVAIDLFLMAQGVYKLSITDLAGREVARLADGWIDRGAKQYYWNGRLRNGSTAPPGVYLIVISGNGVHAIEKLVRY